MKRMFSVLAAGALLAMAGPSFAHREDDGGRVRGGGETRERDNRERDRQSGDSSQRRADDRHDAGRQESDPASADEAASAPDSDASGQETSAQAPAGSATDSSGSGSGGSGEVSVSTSSGSGSGSDSSGSGGSQSSGSGGSDDEGDDEDGDDDGDDSSGSGGDDTELAQGDSDAGPISVEVDEAGRERRAGEVLFIGRSKDLDVVAARGYAIVSRHRLEADDEVVARVGVRGGESIERAVEALRRIAPDARVAPNYLFRASAGDAVGSGARFVPPSRAAMTQTRIGVIDTGADTQDPLLREAIHSTRSFAGPYTPRDHGTRVARIAALNGVRVSVADVFSLDRTGAPVTSGDALVRALDWFVTQDVVVVNISIAGPSSVVLSEMVARARARGMVIVAAAGNDGPGAPPAFPAALDGVVAVTAVDSGGHVYRRANRGSYVDFAALGVDVVVDDPSSSSQRVSGTSFAAPVVSAVLARRLSRRSFADAEAAVTALAAEVIDLGPRGRDSVYGWGQVR